MLEQPGPPLNQVASGAVVGFDLASKNQNHLTINQPYNRGLKWESVTYMFMFDPTDRYPEY